MFGAVTVFRPAPPPDINVFGKVTVSVNRYGGYFNTSNRDALLANKKVGFAPKPFNFRLQHEGNVSDPFLPAGENPLAGTDFSLVGSGAPPPTSKPTMPNRPKPTTSNPTTSKLGVIPSIKIGTNPQSSKGASSPTQLTQILSEFMESTNTKKKEDPDPVQSSARAFNSFWYLACVAALLAT